MIRAASLVIALVAFPQAARDPRYLPLEVGSKWTYQVTREGATGPDLVVTVKEPLKVKGRTCFEVTGLDELTTIVAPVFVSSDAKGIVVVDPKSGPWTTLLQLPLGDGSTWDLGRCITDGSISRKRFDGEEKIEVPAGSYTCVKVVYECVKGGQATPRLTTWYAKGVGIVKARPDGSCPCCGKLYAYYELKSFSPAGPAAAK